MADRMVDYRDPEWVAERLGLDKNTVYKYLQDGTIPALQIARRWLISESELATWLAEQAREQTEARREAAASAAHTAERMSSFSPNAREVVRLAHGEARRYNHNRLGEEHFVLALVTRPECTASKILAALGTDADKLRRRLDGELTPGDSTPPRRLARTPQAKRAIHLAAAQAKQSGSDLVRTEHLLLGIMEAGEGLAFDTLTQLGVTLERVREEITRLSEGR
ncbi:MAG: helix-turn-helix domain-containing protein [Planctomycetes bacterium]|nr:helix-turn-helix domain-containing protein [Planctomycetota bacterium]